MKWRKWVVFRQLAPPALSFLDFLLRHCVDYWRWVFDIIPLFLNTQNEPLFWTKAASLTRITSGDSGKARRRLIRPEARAAGGGRQLGDREKDDKKKKKTSFPFAVVTTQARIMAALGYEDHIGIFTEDTF